MPTMSLPPEAQYESYDALYRAIQLHAKHHGYAFTKRWSMKVNAAGRKKVYLDYDRHNYGTTATKLNQQRERCTNTCANGCQFSILAVESSDRLSWKVKYRLGNEYSSHNHPPSQHPPAHPAH
jgi:hypothetical protein